MMTNAKTYYGIIRRKNDATVLLWSFSDLEVLQTEKDTQVYQRRRTVETHGKALEHHRGDAR